MGTQVVSEILQVTVIAPGPSLITSQGIPLMSSVQVTAATGWGNDRGIWVVAVVMSVMSIGRRECGGRDMEKLAAIVDVCAVSRSRKQWL